MSARQRQGQQSSVIHDKRTNNQSLDDQTSTPILSAINVETGMSMATLIQDRTHSTRRNSKASSQSAASMILLPKNKAPSSRAQGHREKGDAVRRRVAAKGFTEHVNDAADI